MNDAIDIRQRCRNITSNQSITQTRLYHYISGNKHDLFHFYAENPQQRHLKQNDTNLQLQTKSTYSKCLMTKSYI